MLIAMSSCPCRRAAVSHGAGAPLRFVGRDPGPTPTIVSSRVDTVTSIPSLRRGAGLGTGAYGEWPADPPLLAE